MPDSSQQQEDGDLMIDFGHGKASVEINPSHTLADVRQLMLDEFDVDMFPQQDSVHWSFWTADNVRISVKQEPRKIAWKYLTGDALKIKSTQSSLGAVKQVCGEEEMAAGASPPTKRSKVVEPSGTDLSTIAMPLALSGPNDKTSAPGSLTNSPSECSQSDSGGLTKGGWVKRKRKEPAWAIEAAQEITDVAVDIMDLSDEDEDSEDENLAALLSEDPIVEPDLAFEKTKVNLRVIDGLLDDAVLNQRIFSESRRDECSRVVKRMLRANRPRTIIGVYGCTGVGKSSVLNALLDESSVLPTSGSQGCTAAVVELVFNTDLFLDDKTSDAGTSSEQTRQVPVYRGEVEFMTKKDWEDELQILVQECSTDMGRLYSVKPYDKVQPAAATAWGKINQVYGGGTLEKCYDMKVTSDKTVEDNLDEVGLNYFSDEDKLADTDAPPESKQTWTTDRVFQFLTNDERVNELLTPITPGDSCNVIKIGEGLVEPGSDKAKALIKPFAETSEWARMVKEHWASAFREKIDAYVYKNGKEKDAQKWPLVRKVRLLGPWPVLSTGACLVDLPGVKDVNAARAQVAESYLENCSNIWIVAPIKRAVDDGAAKELMGDQFKRRLLMDGQYGNVSFICTSTDKIEASETMRDHADIAKQTPGRWEKMLELSAEAKRLGNKERERSSLERVLQDTTRLFKMAKKTFLANGDQMERERLKTALAEAQAKRQGAAKRLEEYRAELSLAQLQSRKLQGKLKILCAQVRNEYSAGRLQEDFRNGLKEMYLKDNTRAGTALANQQVALPGSFELDVFCTSANDYMKAVGVKSSCDGPAETFFDPADTQIPMLRDYVHGVTKAHCDHFVRDFVESAEQLIRKVELFASGANYAASNEEIALALKACFDTELSMIESKIGEVSTKFEQQMESCVSMNLYPTIEEGAEKSKVAAMATLKSWGSKKKRKKAGRTPECNGLCWSTYQAAVRRNGRYTSKSVGLVDMNQELYEPMEKAFANDWQHIMDASMKLLLSTAKAEVQKICDGLVSALRSSFTQTGLEKSCLDPLVGAGTCASTTGLNSAFERIDKAATKFQRKLTRSMLPKIKRGMLPSYRAAASVACGQGKFDRMKMAMENTSVQTFSNIFSETLTHMRVEISSAVKAFAKSISETSPLLRKKLESFLSLSWDFETAKTAIVDHGILSDLSHLLEAQQAVAKLLDENEADGKNTGVGISLESDTDKNMAALKELGA